MTQTETRPSFTPGPWHKEYHAATGALIIHADNGTLVATIEDDGGILAADEANAHLIAAAPELYEALRQLRAWVEDILYENMGYSAAVAESARNDIEADLRRARAALAKADGR